MEKDLEKMLVERAVAEKKAGIVFRVTTAMGMFDGLNNDLLSASELYDKLSDKCMDLNDDVMTDCSSRLGVNLYYSPYEETHTLECSKDKHIVAYNGSSLLIKDNYLVAEFGANDDVRFEYSDGIKSYSFNKKVERCSLAELTLLEIAMTNLFDFYLSMRTYLDRMKELELI